MSLAYRCLLFCFWMLLPHTVSADVDKALLKRYKRAKRQYTLRHYAKAKADLAPLTSLAGSTSITPYALFYYALSAYHNGEPILAETTWVTLLRAFPDWEQQDEVRYWLGQLRCEAQDYSTALQYLDLITDPALAQPVAQMKTYFLQQIEDLDVLRRLHQQYPQEPVIAQVLWQQLAQQALSQHDLALRHSLARQLGRIAADASQSTAALQKDPYNVAVFFPFFVDEVDYEEDSNHAFVIALYQGIKAAVAALAEQGIVVQLFAYDTKKDPATTAALLAQEELQGMDLIIGPLYADTLPLVADFAHQHQIPLFNPLSENGSVVQEHPAVFLFQASLETQGRKAAEFTLQQVAAPHRIGILYDPTKKDTVRAQAYQAYIEQQTAQEVGLMLPMDPEEATHLLNSLRETQETVEEEEEEAIALEDVAYLYIASDNELMVASVLSTLAIKGLKPCIIGHETWLQQSAFTADRLQQFPLYLIAPHHINYAKPSLSLFRSRFYDQFAQYPTHYAYIGYDMMLFLGQMLHQQGPCLQPGWQRSCYPGAIFEGVVYGSYHDNQHVPIVQVQKEGLVVQQVPSPAPSAEQKGLPDLAPVNDATGQECLDAPEPAQP